MLRGLRVQGFKAWQDTGHLRLAPITVFFGRNSSGKTSLLQFLLMLRQTALSSDRHRVLHLGGNGAAVDLGTYRDMVFGHNEDMGIKFEIGWSLRDSLAIVEPESKAQFAGDTLRFSAAIAPPGTSGLRVERFSYELRSGQEPVLSAGVECTDASKPLYDLTAERYPLKRRRGRPPHAAPLRFYGFPDELVAGYENAAFVDDLALELERALSAIYYLGPLREYPHRFYTWSGATPAQVGDKGQQAVEALLSARDRRVSRGLRKQKESVEAIVARWLKELGLIHEFRVRPIAEHRKEHEVLVRVQPTAEEVCITDVGFGVSQVLPVAVACFHAPAGSTIILEQPEIHLHPSAQAGLADMVIEAIRSRDENGDRHIQVIVESHSEHFLRRLQLRIAEEVVKPEEVAAYVCESVRGKARAAPLEVDLFGNISNWPDGFFGDEMADAIAMSEAAMRRQQGAGL